MVTTPMASGIRAEKANWTTSKRTVTISGDHQEHRREDPLRREQETERPAAAAAR